MEGNREYGIRFRLSHISAHLVDGQYDSQAQEWREGREPFVFSKEFIELFPYYRINTFRVYTGFTYIFHIVPDDIKTFNLQLGFDYFVTNFGNDDMTRFIRVITSNLLEMKNMLVIIYYQLALNLGNGIKGGLSLYYTYISGKSVHGEFYDVNENYSAIGFNFEL